MESLGHWVEPKAAAEANGLEDAVDAQVTSFRKLDRSKRLLDAFNSREPAPN